MQKRREFLKQAALLTSGVVAAGLAGSFTGCSSTTNLNGTNNKFGLQLYTLRDILPDDPKGTLKQVASFGYKQIESYEGKQGMFWGMKNTEFKSYLSDLGMEIVSSHCNNKVDFERKADEAAAIGMKYLVCPFLGPQKNLDAFKRFAEDFNKAGQVCKSRGLRYAYHNHDYSFKKVEGEFPQDVMMSIADKDLVDFEMDMYWVVASGHNPVDWFKKYPNRFRLGHVKERKGSVSVTLGTGEINYSSLLKEATANGMKYFFVEQEAYAGTTPVNAVKDDAEYMKKLKI